MNETALIEALDNIAVLLESSHLSSAHELAFEMAESDIDLREDWVTINGSPIFIGDDGGGQPLSKSDIAKLAHRGGSKYEQDIADQSEKDLSAHLGLPRTADNKPFDLQNEKVGIEVKTMVSNSNGKITQKAEAMARKAIEIKSSKLKKTFTVVVDRRTFDAAGKVTGTAGAPKYYIRDGYGSFRVESMAEVSVPQLKAYISSHRGKVSL